MEESLTEAGNRPVADVWPESSELMTLPAESAPPLAPAGTVDPIWLKSYPAGTPTTIDPDSYPSLHAMLLESCRLHAARPAFESLRARMTYGEWDRDSRGFAAFLREELNCGAGDRVAIMLPNMLAYPVALLGTLRAGLIAVNVNPLYTPRELKEQLKDCGATTIVIMENFAHKLEQVIADTDIRHVVVARLGDFVPVLKRWAFNFANSYIQHAVPAWRFDSFTMLQDACSRAPGEHYADADTQATDVALLQYTGGTTGVPKGAMLTHRNLIANTLQCLAWTGARAKYENETTLTPLPLYHIFSLTANLLSIAVVGGLNVLVIDPRNLDRLIRTMRDSHVAVMSGVNTLYNALVHRPDFAALDFSAMRLRARRWRGDSERGGAPLARDHRHRSGRRLRPDRGVAGGVHQYCGEPEARHRRAAGALDRGEHSRRPRRDPRPGRSRRSLGAWSAGDEGLLAAPRARPRTFSPPTAGCAPATSARSMPKVI